MDLRATDAERERVAAFLRDACLEGCLDADELDERTAAALRARTRGQLSALVADLPGHTGALTPATAAAALPATRRPPALPVLAAVAVGVFLAALAGKEVLLVAAVASAVLLVLAVVLLVAFGPWIAAGAGAVWVFRRLTRP